MHHHYEVLTMIKLKQGEKLAFQRLHYPCRGTMRWCGQSFFKKRNRTQSSSCSLSWKLALVEENPARLLLTWLLQGEQTLLDWSSVRKTVKPRSTARQLSFCNSLTNMTLQRKFSDLTLWSVSFPGWLPSTIDVYKAPTNPTIIRCLVLFRLRTSFSRFFDVEAI